MVLEGAAQALKRRFGRIPPEVVMGTFDDQDSLDFLPNQVFSLRQNEEELASLAFGQLRELLSGKLLLPQQISVPFQLIRRGGAAGAPASGADLLPVGGPGPNSRA